MPNPGFTLAEDAALKEHLSYCSVSDDRNVERLVQVFFRHPEGETEKLYPFITIDLVDIAFDSERQLSEVTYYYANSDLAASATGVAPNIDYYPSEYDAAGLQTLIGASPYMKMDQVVPVNLVYQVTTHCRSQRHDRQLTVLLLRRIFPFRRGFINIPEDDTIRRMDLLDWRQSDVLDQEAGYKKRIFRKVLTVKINAEIPQSDFVNVAQTEVVAGTLSNFDQDNPDLLTSLTEDF